MGYRHYFYKVKKADVETIKDMDYEQLKKYVADRGGEVVDDENYVNFDDVISQTEVHEFGKLYWDDTAERIYSKGVPLFTKDEVQEEFSGYVPYVVGKEGVLEAISIYQEKVLNYYKNMLVGGEERQLPFGITLTVNWEYEHSIFNLVHILKSIDWQDDTILFYGW